MNSRFSDQSEFTKFSDHVITEVTVQTTECHIVINDSYRTGKKSKLILWVTRSITILLLKRVLRIAIKLYDNENTFTSAHWVAVTKRCHFLWPKQINFSDTTWLTNYLGEVASRSEKGSEDFYCFVNHESSTETQRSWRQTSSNIIGICVWGCCLYIISLKIR